MMQSLAIGVSGGCRRGAEEGTCHPNLPRSPVQISHPGCKSLGVSAPVPQPRVFISWGPAARVGFRGGSDRSFCFPGRVFGLRAAGRGGGERGKARSGL